ncbi:MAG: hypothetical protein WAW67_02055 [Candidatus Omnitrophota bacterium]
MKKRVVFLIMLLGIFLFLSGCQNGKNPIKVVDDWIKENLW